MKLAIAALILFCSAANAGPAPRVGKRAALPGKENNGIGPAPELRLTDLNGKTVLLSDYRGKVVLLEFMSTWCPCCHEEMPKLTKLHEKYKDRGLVVLVVIADESSRTVARFANKEKFPFPVLLAGNNRPQQYRSAGVPHGYLLSRSGSIVDQQFGAQGIGETAQKIEKQLVGGAS